MTFQKRGTCFFTAPDKFFEISDDKVGIPDAPVPGLNYLRGRPTEGRSCTQLPADVEFLPELKIHSRSVHLLTAQGVIHLK